MSPIIDPIGPNAPPLTDITGLFTSAGVNTFAPLPDLGDMRTSLGGQATSIFSDSAPNAKFNTIFSEGWWNNLFPNDSDPQNPKNKNLDALVAKAKASANAPGIFEGFFKRGAVILLGFIFVAAGLYMFKDNAITVARAVTR